MVPITACYHGFLVRTLVIGSATTHMVHMYTEMTLMCRVDKPVADSHAQAALKTQANIQSLSSLG